MSIRRRIVFLCVLTLFVMRSATYAGSSFEALRKRMVDEQIKARGISDARVTDAMEKIPRHLFVAPEFAGMAYEDRPLSIGHEQTISQPYIVAYMTEAAELSPGDRVLEIGTGSGYQAAVLAEIVKEVYTIEIVEPLAKEAAERLAQMGYQNIFVRAGDGYLGWPEKAPFDVIMVTAAPPQIPELLTAQLAVGGRMIVPVGSFYQELYRVTKNERGLREERLLPVRFVPMVAGETEAKK